MRPLDPKVTGQLIGCSRQRQEWIDLVAALQVASETPGGPLEGWVFHGTDCYAADAIANFGMTTTNAMACKPGGVRVETRGCHFGRANLAAFYAEDRIESLEDPAIQLVIFGTHLSSLAVCGELAVDDYMIECPVESRMRHGTSNPYDRFMASAQDWQAGLEYYDTVLVLGSVPRHALFQFQHIDDLHELLDTLQERGSEPTMAADHP